MFVLVLAKAKPGATLSQIILSRCTLATDGIPLFLNKDRHEYELHEINQRSSKEKKKTVFIKESRCTSCASQNHNWFYQILQPHIQAISPLLFDVYIHNMLKAKLKARFCPQFPFWKRAVGIQTKFSADSELIIEDMWWICEE